VGTMAAWAAQGAKEKEEEEEEADDDDDDGGVRVGQSQRKALRSPTSTTSCSAWHVSMQASQTPMGLLSAAAQVRQEKIAWSRPVRKEEEEEGEEEDEDDEDDEGADGLMRVKRV
jgi:hypothetical protein